MLLEFLGISGSLGLEKTSKVIKPTLWKTPWEAELMENPHSSQPGASLAQLLIQRGCAQFPVAKFPDWEAVPGSAMGPGAGITPPGDPCGKGMCGLLSAARANTAREGFPELRGITSGYP